MGLQIREREILVLAAANSLRMDVGDQFGSDLKFPNAVVPNAVEPETRKKECKEEQTQVGKRSQKSAKGCKRAPKVANNHLIQGALKLTDLR